MIGRAILVLCLTVSCLVATPPPPPLRVLFIGNSFTLANDVPAMVAAMAMAARKPFEYRVVAFGGFSLQDHWDQGDARRAIGAGRWSFVVLQEGPAAQPASQVEQRALVRRFAVDIRRVGARPALYMVWPAAARQGDFDAVHTSYAQAAADVDGLFLPAGDAWREAWRRDPALELYDRDGVHPTRLGSYLAALVMFEAFFNQSPSGLPALGLAPDRVLIAQQAATATMGRRGAEAAGSW